MLYVLYALFDCIPFEFSALGYTIKPTVQVIKDMVCYQNIWCGGVTTLHKKGTLYIFLIIIFLVFHNLLIRLRWHQYFFLLPWTMYPLVRPRLKTLSFGGIKGKPTLRLGKGNNYYVLFPVGSNNRYFWKFAILLRHGRSAKTEGCQLQFSLLFTIKVLWQRFYTYFGRKQINIEFIRRVCEVFLIYWPQNVKLWFLQTSCNREMSETCKHTNIYVTIASVINSRCSTTNYLKSVCSWNLLTW